MSEHSDPAVQGFFQAILLGGIAFFFAGDLVLAALWAAGRRRGEPLLAPRWSMADLFLAGQAVAGFLVVAALWLLFLMMLFGLLRPGAGPKTSVMLYGVLLPLMAAQQAALIGIPLLVVTRRYRGSAADLGLVRGSVRVALRRAALGALVAVLLLPGTDLLETVSRRWLESAAIPHAAALRALAEQANALSFLQDIRRDPVALAIMGVIIGIIGPFAEEVFFRGFAYRVIRERFGVAAGLIGSALLFSIAHLNPVGLLPIFLIGLLLAWLYEGTGSLAASVGMHCANNLLALLFYFLAPDFSLWDRFFPK